MSTFTHAEIRGAILRAADQIETRPHLFDFSRCSIPNCGTPGCAAGWCASELGIHGIINSATPILVGWINFVPKTKDEDLLWRDGVYCDREFYNRMDEFGLSDWRWKASSCAAALRAYADKYFPASRALVPYQDPNTLVSWSMCAWRPEGLREASNAVL